MIFKEDNIVSKGLCGLGNCAFLLKMSELFIGKCISGNKDNFSFGGKKNS